MAKLLPEIVSVAVPVVKFETDSRIRVLDRVVKHLPGPTVSDATHRYRPPSLPYIVPDVLYVLQKYQEASAYHLFLVAALLHDQARVEYYCSVPAKSAKFSTPYHRTSHPSSENVLLVASRILLLEILAFCLNKRAPRHWRFAWYY